ncbi:unnamed protein product [Colletotrichum noveboracense]|uniref:CN hydrolase domain-containing protein n=1 Tax=Colletotrichum noveboracense TaxID=2664923 RepID=A0A9W4S4I8_9PEZI|nr:unnamed protein product [Colletotrichum noveboracense]
MASTRPIVKVAAVQAAPVSFDLEKSLEKLSKLTAEAAAAGADLVVFPYFDSAIEVPSPAFDILSETARKHNVLLHVGIIEKAGGTLYCTAVLLDREGKLVYKHRKLIPTAAERLVWGQGSGDGLQVQQTDIGKVGSLIWLVDQVTSSVTNKLMQKQLGELHASCAYGVVPTGHRVSGGLRSRDNDLFGTLIYVAPNADDLPAWTASMQHIAKEGRCFVVSVNSVCKVSDFPSDYPPFTAEHPDRRPDGGQWEPEDIVNHGGSCIVGPLGTMLAEPVWDKEEIVYADLRMADITESRGTTGPEDGLDVRRSKADRRSSSLTVNTKAGINVAFSS